MGLYCPRHRAIFVSAPHYDSFLIRLLTHMKSIIDLIGRLFIALIFLTAAGNNIVNFKSQVSGMYEWGWTFAPSLFLGIATFLCITGGIRVALGYRATLGALLLLLAIVPATFLIHDYWNYPDPDKAYHFSQLFKNLAIIGGLLMMMSHGTGKYSIRRVLASTKS